MFLKNVVLYEIYSKTSQWPNTFCTSLYYRHFYNILASDILLVKISSKCFEKLWLYTCMKYKTTIFENIIPKSILVWFWWNIYQQNIRSENVCNFLWLFLNNFWEHRFENSNRHMNGGLTLLIAISENR
jgi:hypothetical protein